MVSRKKPKLSACRFCGKPVERGECIQLIEGVAVYCEACLVAAEEFGRSAAKLVLTGHLTAEELRVRFSNGTVRELLRVPSRAEPPGSRSSNSEVRFVTCAKCRKPARYDCTWPGTGLYAKKPICNDCHRAAAKSIPDDIPF